MRNYVLAAFLASACFVAPAAAQETNPVFTGPRIAVLGGYDAIKPGSSADSELDGDDQTVDGFLYGGEIGYDFSAGGAVIGIEGEISDSTGRVNVASTDPDFFGFGRVSTARDLYVGARAGFLASPRTLIYAKGGYTNAKLNVVAVDGATRQDANFKLDGYRVGAGVEHAMGSFFLPNAFVKLEYRYSNYGDARARLPGFGTTESFDIDTDRHQVVAGVGIRF